MATKAEAVLPYNRQSVDAAKAVDGKETEYQIGADRGLKLRVYPTGRATYLFRYTIEEGRHRHHRKMALGRRDEMSLAEARKAADDLRHKIGTGVDPARQVAARNVALTFQELSEKRLAEDVRIGDATRTHYRQSLTKDVYPVFGNKIAGEVTADDVTEVLNAIEERGALVNADRAKAAIGSTFKWARQRWPGKYPTNPTMGLGKRAPTGERRRILSNDEIAQLWSALENPAAPLSPPLRTIFKLALLTGKRRNEVGGARVQELHLAGHAPVWIIPGDSKLRGKVVKGRSKNAEDQVVQLSRQAAYLFRVAIELNSGSGYVFPADASRGVANKKLRTEHIHGDSISMAMRRLRAHCRVEDVTTHDLRRTCATWLGNQGAHPVVIEIILGHVGEGVTRRHYNHAQMADQVRTAMQQWADFVEQLTRSLERLTKG